MADGTAANPDSRNTDELVQSARSGDVEAFGQLVEQQYRFIFSTAFRWLGNRSDAEDVTQIVCMKLARALRSFDGRSAFTSWLYRITLNAVRDLQRSHQRRARQADELAFVSTDEFKADQDGGLHLQDIWRIVHGLPEKQRAAVLLVYAEELSHAEAAVIMNCKEATVAWHIHKARKSLMGLL